MSIHMDAKNQNMVTIILGVIFVGLGVNNIIHATTWWHYLTFIIGVIIICLGVYGYKTGRKF